MSMGWDESLNVGAPELDAQHREIASRMKAIEDSIIAGRRELVDLQLESLRAMMEAHFEAEEAWMKSVAYPRRAEHLGAHDLARQVLRRAVESFRRSGADDHFLDMVSRLASWLDIHLRSEDLRLGTYSRQLRDQKEDLGVPN